MRTTIIIELLVLLIAGYLVTGVAITTLKRKELLPKKKGGVSRIFWLVGLFAAALCLNSAMAAIILGLCSALTAISLLMTDTEKEKRLAIGLGRLLGVPGTIGIVANVIISIVTTGLGKGKMLYWLIAPGLYYVFLAIAGYELGKDKQQKRNYDFVLPLALTTVFVVAIAVILVFSKDKGVI